VGNIIVDISRRAEGVGHRLRPIVSCFVGKAYGRGVI